MTDVSENDCTENVKRDCCRLVFVTIYIYDLLVSVTCFINK